MKTPRTYMCSQCHARGVHYIHVRKKDHAAYAFCTWKCMGIYFARHQLFESEH